MNASVGEERGKSPPALGARDLVRAARRGTLSTLMTGDGYPYRSLVEILPMADGDVVLFLSQLAEHRRFLTADPRASVVIAPHIQAPSAMAQGCVTLIGPAEAVEDRSTFTQAYIWLHPGAASYIHFPDFGFNRLRVDRVRYIAGFGQVGWIENATYREALSG